jgi:hypothetical protein
MGLQTLGQVFLSPGISVCGEESLSQGLKPHLSAVLNVRAKARTYLRSKGKSKSRYLRFVRHNHSARGFSSAGTIALTRTELNSLVQARVECGPITSGRYRVNWYTSTPPL